MKRNFEWRQLQGLNRVIDAFYPTMQRGVFLYRRNMAERQTLYALQEGNIGALLRSADWF
jgi:hypothetical protein